MIAQESNKFHELATIALTNKNWYCPKKITYLPLNINNLSQFEIKVVDFDGDPLNFDGTQSIIVLHFK